jgi:hypothetical protein
MSQQEALFLLCGYPVLIAVIFAVIAWFWRSMELSARENDTKRYPRYTPKPYNRSPDMLDKE